MAGQPKTRALREAGLLPPKKPKASSTLTPEDQQYLAALNEDKEPWMDPNLKLDEVMLAQARLAIDDVEGYCDLASAYEGRPVHPHGMHHLLHECLKYGLESHQHVLLVLPPESGKTTQVEKYIVWRIASNPKLRVAMVSASEKTARRNLTHARKSLVSPLTKAMWPHLKPDIKRSAAGGGWSQEHLYLEGNTDPSVVAYSLLSDCQGMRFDLLWLDDFETMQSRFSEPKRIEVHAALHNMWLNRMTDDGLVIMTNNCWTKQGSVYKALDSTSFLVLWLGYEGTDRIYYRIHHAPPNWPHKTSGRLPLWDKVWPKDRLERKRAADPPSYKRMYEQNATVADEMRLPAPESWPTYKPQDLPGPETGARAFAYLDPAGGRHVERGDYAAITVGVLSWHRVLYVLGVWLRRTPPEEQVMQLWRIHERLQSLGFPGLHQAWFEVLPKDERWIQMSIDQVKAKLFPAGDPDRRWPSLMADYPDTTMSKEGRIECLHGPLTNGEMLFPEGFIELSRSDTPQGKSWATLLAQVEDFGSKGCAHDDGPDALEGLRRSALLVGPGIAAPGTGLYGPREQAQEERERREQSAPGRFEFDLQRGLVKRIAKPVGFLE